MIIEKHIKEIENLLNKEKVIKYKLLQISFNIACLKFKLSNGKIYIAKFFVEKKHKFNAINGKIKIQRLRILICFSLFTENSIFVYFFF